MKASAKNCLLAGFLNGLNGGAGGSRVSGASIFSAIPACIVVGFSKRKPLEPLWLKGFFVGGGEGNRTPVRKLADIVFSERSHDFGIPLAERLAAGFRLR